MRRQQITTGVVGILIGFVLGFFLSQALTESSEDRPGGVGPTPVSDAEGVLPSDHPPAEVLDHLRRFQEQAEADPEDKEVRILLGNLYYDMGRFDAAVVWYEEAIDLDPANVSVRTDLGTSHLYTGNTERAIELYLGSLDIEPTHAQTLQNLGFAYYAVKDFANALETWERLLETNPDYPFVEQIREQMEHAREHLGGDRS